MTRAGYFTVHKPMLLELIFLVNDRRELFIV